MKKIGVICIGIILLLTTTLWFSVYVSHAVYQEGSLTMEVRRAVLKALGVYTLNLSSECAAVRNLTEGVYGCMSDIPGGYSYYQSCDIVGFSRSLQAAPYAMRIINKEREPL